MNLEIRFFLAEVKEREVGLVQNSFLIRQKAVDLTITTTRILTTTLSPPITNRPIATNC